MCVFEHKQSTVGYLLVVILCLFINQRVIFDNYIHFNLFECIVDIYQWQCLLPINRKIIETKRME